MVSGEPDGTVRFRTDITLTIQHANYPFPPDFDILLHSKINQANNNEETKTWDEDDWGAGKDLFLIGISLEYVSATEFNTIPGEGFEVALERTSDNDRPFIKTVTDSPLQDGASGNWILQRTFYFPVPIRIDSTDELQFSNYNTSGQICTVSAYVMHFVEET